MLSEKEAYVYLLNVFFYWRTGRNRNSVSLSGGQTEIFKLKKVSPLQEGGQVELCFPKVLFSSPPRVTEQGTDGNNSNFMKHVLCFPHFSEALP